MMDSDAVPLLSLLFDHCVPERVVVVRPGLAPAMSGDQCGDPVSALVGAGPKCASASAEDSIVPGDMVGH